MEPDEIRSVILEALEAGLDAQLRAVRRLRAGSSALTPSDDVRARRGAPPKASKSNVDMAFDILTDAGHPLHINDILEGIKLRFHAEVDRESLVSALSKRVARSDRFERVGKNTFSLLTPK
jgi:hypothetical protein